MKKVLVFLKRHYPVLVLTIMVFFCVTFSSECSFLYRTNEWGDAHCYHTVAMMMNNGKVLYRDIFEQKGPYLYFIHMAAIAIAPGKYYGMYLFELLFGWLFAFASYKTIRLFIENKAICVLSVCLSLTTYYLSMAFMQGDSVEEMMIPFYALCLYWLIKMAKDIKDITWYELLLSGAFCGLALFSKFSLVPFFAGFGGAIFVLFCLKKKVANGFLAGLFFFIGLGLASIPALVYCGVYGIYGDLWQVYFYNNVFHYSAFQPSPIGEKFLRYFQAWGVRFFFGFNYFFFIVIGFFYIVFSKTIKKDKVFFSVLSTYIVLNLFITLGGVNYQYYGLPNVIYTFIFVVALVDLLSKVKKPTEYIKKHAKPLAAISIAIFAVITFAGNLNMPRMFLKEDELLVYHMKKHIEKKENATVLMYGHLDIGVYYLCDIMPTTKYFTGLNGDFAELKKEQQRIIDEGEVTFVIVRQGYMPERIETHYYEATRFSFSDLMHTDTFYLFEHKA